MKEITWALWEYKTLFLSFLFVVLGVVFHDYTNTINGEDDKIYIIRIIIVSMLITLIMRGLHQYLIARINVYFYYFLCSSAGWVNYQLYGLLDLFGSNLFNVVLDKLKSRDDRQDKKIKELEDKFNDHLGDE